MKLRAIKNNNELKEIENRPIKVPVSTSTSNVAMSLFKVANN